ncbi:hypothetical protein AAFF_G00210020 [Aldrovandia affinis]|uniref:DUF5641 domain-containing protein n=1 Tax=Aldrovandia affinis TaxID=143900 RepID=A0AAD7WUH2_9TELE|nr:hypothetical protein AAFF_G00210020 [Aldrovandia affinis]
MAPVENCLVNTASEVSYVNRPSYVCKLLLKISKVIIRNGNRTLEAYAVLDDGSQRTILLHAAAKKLGLEGKPEDLALCTVRQELQVLHGAAISFTISPAAEPMKSFKIHSAFTAEQLGLAEHTYPVSTLQKKYRHLAGLPLQSLNRVHSVLLIGSDCTHLITPIEPVRLGPPAGPAAVRTHLGWTLQGPAQDITHSRDVTQCLFTPTLSPMDLLSHVEKLQMDVLPYRSKNAAVRSQQDQVAVHILQEQTVRVNIDGIERYTTPLLRVKNMPQLQAPPEAVLPQLRGIEKRLMKAPGQAAAYQVENHKLEEAGYAVKLEPHQVENTEEAWPALGPSLLTVLLHFRENSLAFSSDIRGMFHQVQLLPTDRPLLRFLWRDLKQDIPPSVYEWQCHTQLEQRSLCSAWDKKREWDDTQLPDDLLFAWRSWETELEHLPKITLPRTESPEGKVDVSFLAARSRVAPKKQQSIPRLELCAALTGAQLSKTVLTWLLSDLCRYKVFVGTRVAEVQELTESATWRHVPSGDNPADDITCGLALRDLNEGHRWTHGPAFLKRPSEEWPGQPCSFPNEPESEMRWSVVTVLATSVHSLPDPQQHQTLSEYLKIAVDTAAPITADAYAVAELEVLRHAQGDSFPDEVAQLKAGKPVTKSSRLLSLAPELNKATGLIRVGGHLRRSSDLASDVIHPIVLDPQHPLTRLIIQDYYDKLHHPGQERVFTEIRRCYWVLHGREAVRRHQRKCAGCRKWRGHPDPPKMADLPPARQRIFKPAFYSTGVDCFGPYIIKIGRRNEKSPAGKAPHELLCNQVVYEGPEILGRRRWRHSQILADHFWKHFIKHYLPGLQACQKWRTEAAADLQVGDIVMIIDNQLPRALWPVGKVTQVFPGADNRVRSAEVLVKDRTYTWPVARLISLPALPEEE